MSGLELRSPIVIGHSWGGGVTLVHATASATRSSLAASSLVDPLLRMPLVDAAEYRQALSEHLGKPRRETGRSIAGCPSQVAHVRRLLEGRGA